MKAPHLILAIAVLTSPNTSLSEGRESSLLDDVRMVKVKEKLDSLLSRSVLQFARGERRIYTGTVEIKNSTSGHLVKTRVVGSSTVKGIGLPTLYLFKAAHDPLDRNLLVQITLNQPHREPKPNMGDIRLQYELSLEWESSAPWIGTAYGSVAASESTKIRPEFFPITNEAGEVEDFGLSALATVTPLEALRPKSNPRLPFVEAQAASLSADLRTLPPERITLCEIMKAEPGRYVLGGGINFTSAQKYARFTLDTSKGVYKIDGGRDTLTLDEARKIDPSLPQCEQGQSYVFEYSGKIVIPVDRISESFVVVSGISAPSCERLLTRFKK